MKRSVGLPLVLLSCLAIPSAWGQDDSASSGIPDGYRFGAAVDAVHLSATVLDKKGRLINDLTEGDFLVYENGVPQELVYFARGTDAPVDVMLLVDGSGSMDMVSKVANARNAAIQLVHILGPEDRVAVYAFNRNVVELCPFTKDKEEAIRALQELEPFGSTAIYDAVAQASDLIEHQGFGRRAIVLITDGIDTSSEFSVAEAVEIAKGVDLPVYALRVLSPLDDPANDAFLDVHGKDALRGESLVRFTAETGGKLYEASQIGALRVASLRVRDELKTQYRLGYSPRNAKRDGTFRRIEIYVRHEKVEVRTRKGYYARTDKNEAGNRPVQ